MIVGRERKVVILGMMSRMPVAGNIWLVAQYMLGFEDLGVQAYYVEAHGMTPYRLMATSEDDGSVRAAEFIAGVMNRFDFADRWAFHSRHDDRYFGMSRGQLLALYASADLIINLHGSTVPLPEHGATGRLVYLETDPVELEIELHDGKQQAFAFLEPHVAFFSWGLNYGRADCRVPQQPQFQFKTTAPPIVSALWNSNETPTGDYLTTVGNWWQPGRVVFEGETYYWSKDREFRKVIDLPLRVGPQFELALSSGSIGPPDVELLQRNGWRVRDSLEFSYDLDAYRDYVCRSRGEFTVAKDQNVRLRSGWFSERSASYLAAGRPVITQDTGFGNVLPVGEGLFSFTTVEEAHEAVTCINADYTRHSQAASVISRDYFSHTKVLPPLLRSVS